VETLLYLGIIQRYRERLGTARNAVDASIRSLMRQSGELETAGVPRVSAARTAAARVVYACEVREQRAGCPLVVVASR
jgi:hypothetical protein